MLEARVLFAQTNLDDAVITLVSVNCIQTHNRQWCRQDKIKTITLCI